MTTLSELKQEILSHVPNLVDGVNPHGNYADTCIMLMLRKIHREFGEETAQQTIKDLGLDQKGW